MRSSSEERRARTPRAPSDDIHRAPRRGVATGAAIVVGACAAAGGLAGPAAFDVFAVLAPEPRTAPFAARELLVVDGRVPRRDLLLRAAREGVATLVLDPGRDGLAQIEAALAGRDYAAVHLVAHGRPGEVRIGATVLDAATARAESARLGRWFARRAPYETAPELLVYACDAASGPLGVALVRALADATGAEVAASTDRTGGDAQGADWILEARTGSIESLLPISLASARAYPATLETFTVTTDAASGPGSLAQAVADANSNSNPEETDVVELGAMAGTIAVAGTLTITEPLSIEGPGADELTLDGGGAARLLDATAALAIEGVTLANGAATDGGGGAVRVTGAPLVVDACALLDNSASEGGAIAVYDADLVVVESVLSGNEADRGGALFATVSTVDVEESTLEDNEATADGGAIAIDASMAFVHSSLLAGNDAGDRGGAIHAGHAMGGPPLVSIMNSTISGNTAESGGGVAASGNAYVELVHATVTENLLASAPVGDCFAAGVDGCGLVGAGIVIVESSIVAGNGGASGSVDLAGDALDLELEVRSSLVGLLEGGVATSGEPIFGEDPRLGALADNGGASRTHALLSGSPAIDRGENPGAFPYDQRGTGFPRSIGEAPDMGAYEWSEDDRPGGGGGGGGDPDAGLGDAGLVGGPKGTAGSDGCGCSVPGGGSAAGGAAPFGLAALVEMLVRFRRSRRTR